MNLLLRFNLLLIFSFGLTLTSTPVVADIYRCDKQAGVITLSNIEKGPNCKKMVLPPPEKKSDKTAAQNTSGASGSTGIPDAKQPQKKTTYQSALSERNRIIQEELDLEKDRLSRVDDRVAVLSKVSKRSAAQQNELDSLIQKQALYKSNIALLQKELTK